MKRIIAVAALLWAGQAIAADNAVILDPGSTVTMRTKDIGGGVQSPYNILGDTSGVAIYGVAGTANTNVLSVQGIASGTALPISAAASSLVDGSNVTQGAKADSACGTATGTCSVVALLKYLASIGLPVTNANSNGIATPANSSPVVQAGLQYETIAASATAQVMGGSGATGDYLSHCVIYPGTTSPGVVTVFDNANAAGTNAIAFTGGSSSVSNLVPISIPVGAFSTAGPWKVTTGTNVIVTCYGKFS